ncbi:MAG: glycosyltransferase, partial [Patescibacteria group bacterium]
MKIILACGIFPPDIGGPATYADKLAGELNRLGHEVVVLTYRDKTISKLETRNSKLQLVIVSRKFPKLVRHFVYFWKLFWLAKTADVIYAQNAVSVGLPSVLAAGILRKKLVLKIVGDAAWERASE